MFRGLTPGRVRISERNRLDDRATAALQPNDERELDQRLNEMFQLVRTRAPASRSR